MMLDHASDCAIGSGVSVCTCGAVSRAAAEALGVDPTAFIHEKAHVEGSRIGARTKVWQFASVTGGTAIGEDCSIWPHVMLDGPVIGNRCKIAARAIGPGFRIGNEVFVGPGVVLCNDMWPTVDPTGWDVEMLRDGRCVTVRIGDRAWIGANSTILPGVSIGEGAAVSAHTRCAKDVPAGHLMRHDGTIVEINTAWARKRMKAA